MPSPFVLSSGTGVLGTTIMGKMTWCLALVVVIGCGASTLGETRRGIVLAENGSPGKGAHVWAVKLWSHKLERVESTADDQGRFAVALGPGEWLIHASLGDQGLADRNSVKVSEGHALRPLILRLMPQGRLRVRLLEAETGKPIVGGKLVIDNGLDPITDQDGRFELGGLDRARYYESFVVATGRERKCVLFEMSERPVTDLEIAVPLGGKAVGRLVAVNGNPIPRAFVGRSTSGSSISLTGLWVQADAQGRFEYDGLVLDRMTWLNAEAEGFEGIQHDDLRADSGGGPLSLEFWLTPNPAGRSFRLDAPKGASLKARPRVAKRRDISGLVLDPDKNPVAGAIVRWGMDLSGERIETKTDGSGRFRLPLVPDRSAAISVTPKNADLAPATPTVEGQGDQEVRVVLTKGHTAMGVVCDDRRAPFAGVRVLPIIGVFGQRSLELEERSVQTNAQGRFTLTGLPVASTTFTFLGNGVGDLRNQTLELDKENVVTMWSAGTIRGKVADHEGKPVRNFRVLLSRSRKRKPDDRRGSFFPGFLDSGLTYTSDDGSFIVRNLTGGSVQRVTVLAPGLGEGTIDRAIAEPLSHRDPGQVLTFRLAQPYTLKVHAVEELSGKPVPNAHVALIYNDPSVDLNSAVAGGYYDTTWRDSVHARTDAQGVATFSPLSFSEATVLIQAAGYARRHFGWRDGSAELTVKLSLEAVVSGELLDATTDKPLDGVIVTLSSPGARELWTAVHAGEAGRFRVEGISRGTYGFSIILQSGPPLHREMLKLEPGQHIERNLRLKPAER